MFFCCWLKPDHFEIEFISEDLIALIPSQEKPNKEKETTQSAY